MGGVATTLTTFIELQNNTKYPKAFITIPHVEQHFGVARHASSALALAYVPRVGAAELELWNEYSVANQGWTRSQNTVSSKNNDMANTMIPTAIWQFEANEENEENEGHLSGEHECSDHDPDHQLRVPVSRQSAPFAPLWTFSPPSYANDPSMINFDLSSSTHGDFDQALQNADHLRKPLILDLCFDMMNLFGLNRDDHNDDAVIATPVFGNFSDTAEIVGHLLAVVPWSQLLELHLPDEIEPCQVVLESTCGHLATFDIRNTNVTFQEDADDHNHKYNSLGVPARLTAFEDFAGIDKSSVEGICTLTMTVYPTTEFEESYYTQKPLWYALTVLAIFVLTSALFCLFDGTMTRQHNHVKATAKKQNAIVSSLFPKSIQAKVMQQMEADNNRLSKTGKAGLKNFLFDTNIYGDVGSKELNAAEESADGPPKRLDKSKPIADLFPETTIMFADIAG